MSENDSDWIALNVREPDLIKKIPDLIYKEEVYEIVGICMEIHKILGRGFSEVVYKDAIEHEFTAQGYQFEREKKYEIEYKGIVLPHFFFADFIFENKS